MREIKFRAWDDKGKEWLMGYGVGSLGGFHIDGELVYLDQWTKVLDDAFHEKIDLKIMQFTGIDDFHGKEIYEGDIVKTGDEMGEVQYDPQQGAYIILLHPHNKKVKSGCYNLASTHPSPLKEIIGNIYQNPELLTPTHT